MRYPTDNFALDWYDAQGFGTPTAYGAHEAADLNLYTGGNTDIGQSLYAIANGRVVLVHNHTELNTFGKHVWIEIDGPWGKRFVHYSHCNEVFVSEGQQVSEGQRIATVGKTGTTFSHCHFAIAKTMEGDNIANSREELRRWENVYLFLGQWVGHQPSQPINDQTPIPVGGEWGTMEVQAIRSTLNDQKRRIQEFEQQPPPVQFNKPIAKLHFQLAQEFEKL